jgi:hypothetical protein
MTLRDELAPFARTDREAARLVGDIFDSVITALKRDRCFADIPLLELEDFGGLAYQHRDAADRRAG